MTSPSKLTPHAAEIVKSLRVFIERGQVFEVRALKTPRDRTVSGYFDDLDEAARASVCWSGTAPAVYFTLNPVKRALLARAKNRLITRAETTTSDADITGRRWFFIDFDAVRPSGISSTATEHAAALERARICRDFLGSLGWPFPVEADSGNGAHLLYGIDLPNDSDAAELLKRCLQALDFKFSDDAVTVDCTTFNAARICKLYGTKSCKGDDTSDRPHRISRVLSVPTPLVKVSTDLLEALAAMCPPEKQRQQCGMRNGSADKFDLERWIAEHNLQIVACGPWNGTGRRWVLNPCPWNPDHDDRAAYIVRSPDGAIGAGCHHNGCKGRDWHALRDVIEPAWRERKGNLAPAETGGASIGSDHTHARPQIITAAELLRMELPEPKWAVQGIIPEGLSLLAGKPKLGKSWLALHLAIAVATGGIALGSIQVERGDVLYLALEDTMRRLKDRIAKLMGPHELTEWPTTLHLARTCPRQDKGGLAELVEWLSAHRAARLVIVDTWPRFRPVRAARGDCYEEDYARAAELKAAADQYGAGILGIAHCRKLDANDPLDEVSGTLGLTGAADAVAVLRRERGQHDATLFLTGRDIDEREIALRWDPQYALWSILGDADEYRLSKERQEVLDALKTAGEPLTPTKVAKLLSKKENAVKKLLWTMSNAGQIESCDGKYAFSNPGNRGNPATANLPSDAVTTVTTVTAHGRGQRPAPEKPSEPPWTAKRFAEAFGRPEPRPRALLLEEAQQAGLSESKAEKLLKAALECDHLHSSKVAGKTLISTIKPSKKPTRSKRQPKKRRKNPIASDPPSDSAAPPSSFPGENGNVSAMSDNASSDSPYREGY